MMSDSEDSEEESRVTSRSCEKCDKLLDPDADSTAHCEECDSDFCYECAYETEPPLGKTKVVVDDVCDWVCTWCKYDIEYGEEKGGVLDQIANPQKK